MRCHHVHDSISGKRCKREETEEMMTRKTELAEVLALLGSSHQRIGERFGISRQAVRKWVVRGKIPYLRAVEIERMTEGRVRIEDIRGLIS